MERNYWLPGLSTWQINSRLNDRLSWKLARSMVEMEPRHILVRFHNYKWEISVLSLAVRNFNLFASVDRSRRNWSARLSEPAPETCSSLPDFVYRATIYLISDLPKAGSRFLEKTAKKFNWQTRIQCNVCWIGGLSTSEARRITNCKASKAKDCPFSVKFFT